jgi:hypothetical protein
MEPGRALKRRILHGIFYLRNPTLIDEANSQSWSFCYEHRPPGLGACLGGSALAHRPPFFGSGHAVVLLPSLDLLSWFNDTSIDSL